MQVIVTALVGASLACGCAPTAGHGGSSGLNEAAPPDESLKIVYDDDLTSATIATITDTASGSSLTVTGTKEANGELKEITGLSGSAGQTQFAAYFEGDVPTHANLPRMAIECAQTGESSYLIGVAFSAPPPGARADGTAEYELDTQFVPGLKTIEAARNHCEDYRNCSWRVYRDLQVLRNLAYYQVIFNYIFDQGCMLSSDYNDDECRSLLAVVGLFGQAMDGMIQADPDLPADVRAACWDVNAACAGGDAEDADVQDDNEESDDDSVCGRYSDEGTELPKRITFYGDHDIYEGHPVGTTDVAIYAGQHVGYTADGFYDYDFFRYADEDVEITWELDGSSGALVTTNRAKIVYVHALTAGELTLCVLGTLEDTGEVLGYRSVPITVATAPFWITSAEAWRPEDYFIGDSASISIRYEGYVEFPVNITLESAPSGCAPDAPRIPCYLDSKRTVEEWEDGVLTISYDFADRCAEAGVGARFPLSIYFRDATGAYSPSFEFTYECVTGP